MISRSLSIDSKRSFFLPKMTAWLSEMCGSGTVLDSPNVPLWLEPAADFPRIDLSACRSSDGPAEIETQRRSYTGS